MGHNSKGEVFIMREQNQFNLTTNNSSNTGIMANSVEPKNITQGLKKKLILKELQNNYLQSGALIVNMGPSFFYLHYINNRTGQTFNYLYGTYKFINKKNESNLQKVPFLKVKRVKASFESKSNDRNAVVRMNLFNEKCICDNCIFGSYIFLVKHGCDLQQELFQVLNCEDCKLWGLDWLAVLIEQSFIFFCCIKDGLLNERLLDSASVCAKMLLVKPPKNELLKIEYGYQCFQMKFIYKVRYQQSVDTEVEFINKNCFPIPFVGTGREEREIIDGLRVVSFTTEADMNEYTDLEMKYLNNTKVTATPGRVVPTKTSDVTKIKGWRHKVFSVCVDENKKEKMKKSLYEEGLNKNVVNIGIKKQEKLLQSNTNQQKKDKKYEQLFTSEIKVSRLKHVPTVKIYPEKLGEFYDEEMKRQCAITIENVPGGEVDYEVGILKNLLNDDKKKEGQMEALPVVANETTPKKISETTAMEENDEVIFRSSDLNVYLSSDSSLCVDFAETTSPKSSLLKDVNMTPVVQLEKLPDAIVIQELALHASMSKNVESRESADVILENRTSKKQVNKPLLQIWVHDRPIQVGEKDNLQKISHLSVNKINNCKKSTGCQTDFPPLLEGITSQNNSDCEESECETDTNRPRLLTARLDQEDDFIPKKFVAPNDYWSDFIPVIHGCVPAKCSCKSFSLGMLLTIGKGRHLSREAIENLETLNVQKDNVIDERMARIAACAVVTRNDKKALKRMAVPVVSKGIINGINNWEQRLAYDMISDRIKRAPLDVTIDPDVVDVVNGLVDYTERKLSPITIDYDPMYIPTSESPKKVKKDRPLKRNSKILRELKRLINVSIIDESNENADADNTSNCDNEFCLKGCICQSLNNKARNLPLHCGKVDCIFQCSCPSKKLYEQNTLKSDYLDDTMSLAKEEITWHQTIIRSEDDRIEVMNSIDKSKREKKLPTRFRTNVLLGREMYPGVVARSPPESDVTVVQPDEKGKLGPKSGPSFRNHVLQRRLGFCADTMEETPKLIDVFIWCSIHNKYNCTCIGHISRMKNNAFIWRPHKTTRYLPYKLMMDMEIRKEYTIETFVYDPNLFSARTYGTWIKYNLRNRSQVFQEKRKCEFENNVLACTNSFVKMKIYMLGHRRPKQEDSTENSDLKVNDVYKSDTPIENVYITRTNTDEDVDVGVDIYPDVIDPAVCDPIIIELDSDSDVEIQEDINMTLPVPKVDSFVQKKRPATLQKRRNHVVPNTKIATNLKRPEEDPMPVEIISSDSSISSDSDLEIMECASDPLKDTSDQEQTNLLQNVLVERSLENKLVRLEEHPLKDELFGSDKLPNLALLCLTPGIGYLPILEFKPEVLLVQDPVTTEVFHSFKNLETANVWMNIFFKNRIIFESLDTSLKWVIVKPGILKLKGSTPFTTALLENPTLIVTKDGGLIFKRKDMHTGNMSKQSFKVEPLSLKPPPKSPNRNKRKSSSFEVVDICGGDGKRQKIQLENVTTNDSNMKTTKNFYEHFPPRKLQETITGIPSYNKNMVERRVNTNNIRCNPTSLRIINNNETKGPSQTLANDEPTPAFKSATIKPVYISRTNNGPLRLQVHPSVRNICANNVIPPRAEPVPSHGSPPSANHRTPSISVSKIISRDGRPVILHNNALIPINVKSTHFIPKVNPNHS